jgi:hypothetical protein
MGKLCKINKFILQLFCYRFVTFCFLNTFWAFLEVKVFLFGIFNENAMFNIMAYFKNRKGYLLTSNGHLLRQKASSNDGLTAFFFEVNHFGSKIRDFIYFQTISNL